MYPIFPYPFMTNASPFLFSQGNYSGAGGGGKAIGDSIQKGDLFGFLGGLGMIGWQILPTIWQINNTNNIVAMNNRLLSFQSVTFPQQWPTGIRV